MLQEDVKQHITAIRTLANNVVHTKYPLIEERYCNFDIAVILQSYFALLEHMNKEPGENR